MVISQGEIWWADLPGATGSGPGFRRPVIVVQCDALNGSRLATTVCVPLTSNLKWGTAPGNVTLSARLTELPKDSVANSLPPRFAPHTRIASQHLLIYVACDGHDRLVGDLGLGKLGNCKVPQIVKP
jgi:mRNA-degrading endonuclease toxin of MazEF toxin-antitoxin module